LTKETRRGEKKKNVLENLKQRDSRKKFDFPQNRKGKEIKKDQTSNEKRTWETHYGIKGKRGGTSSRAKWG